MGNQEAKPTGKTGVPLGSSGGPAARSSYEPPTIIWEEDWIPVVLAASCARHPAEGAMCSVAPGSG